MNDKAEQTLRPHSVTITDRNLASITGVEDVDSFNEQMIALNTTSGAMTVIGDQLHVSKLNLEEGKLMIDGRIIALEYDDRLKPQKGSGIKRLFK